jgi:hypothetical protein
VGAVNQSVSVQDLEVFANGHLRSLELVGEFSDQYSSLMIEEIKNGAAAFFVEQVGRPVATCEFVRRAAARISFYSVLFRLSRGKLLVAWSGRLRNLAVIIGPAQGTSQP